jgi:hypothetical protein
VRYSLLADIGRPAVSAGSFTHEVPDRLVIEVLEELLP